MSQPFPSIAALYDGGPRVPMPARTPGWACVQRIEPEVELAAQTAELQPGDVDALWLAARDDGGGHDLQLVAAVIAALPADAGLIVDCARGAESLRTAGARVRQLGFDPAVAIDRGWADTDAALAEAVALRRHAPGTWCCDGSVWHDAGADAVLELAIVIAGLLAATRTDARDGAGLAMRLATGGELLVDIAKLRAARALWHACTQRLALAATVPIHARTRRHMGAADDADTHLVHATLDGFAAALGGADTLAIERHDLRGPAAAGARRWARNISHVLRAESGLDRIDDALAGAHAIESLTDALARAAWQRVVAIEQAGGLFAALPALRGELGR